MKKIEVGSSVKYCKPFLKSICASATDPMWRAKGEIVAINGNKDFSIATIKWNMPDIPERVNVKNLIIVGQLKASEA